MGGQVPSCRRAADTHAIDDRSTRACLFPFCWACNYTCAETLAMSLLERQLSARERALLALVMHHAGPMLSGPYMVPERLWWASERVGPYYLTAVEAGAAGLYVYIGRVRRRRDANFSRVRMQQAPPAVHVACRLMPCRHTSWLRYATECLHQTYRERIQSGSGARKTWRGLRWARCRRR